MYVITLYVPNNSLCHYWVIKTYASTEWFVFLAAFHLKGVKCTKHEVMALVIKCYKFYLTITHPHLVVFLSHACVSCLLDWPLCVLNSHFLFFNLLLDSSKLNQSLDCLSASLDTSCSSPKVLSSFHTAWLATSPNLLSDNTKFSSPTLPLA